jgi:tRNA pseudouridine38-40 synthase
MVTSAQTVRIDLSYKGNEFRGFAENPGVRTVGAELRRAIEIVFGEPVELTVAGRTDAGVHAAGQVVSFPTTSERLDCERLRDSLNGICSPEIRIQAVKLAPQNFDARFSATQRRYHYNILNSPAADPLRAEVEWHIVEKLDIDAMNSAANRFLGEHDFTSFCRRPKDKPEQPLTRRIRESQWTCQPEQRIQFALAANAFCHQMVRSLTGFCVAVGLGKRSADEFEAVLESKDRSAAPPIAPPHGLTLMHVTYPEDE